MLRTLGLSSRYIQLQENLEQFKSSTVIDKWKTDRQSVVVVSITSVNNACQGVEYFEFDIERVEVMLR